MQQEDLEYFTSLARSWGRFAVAAVRSYIAVRGRSGWQLRWNHLELTPTNRPEANRTVHTRSIFAHWSVRTIDSGGAESLITEFLKKQGQEEVGGFDSSLERPAHLESNFQPHQPPYRAGPLRLPTMYFVGKPLPPGELPQNPTLDLEVMAFEPPFSNFLNLLGEFGAFPDHGNAEAASVSSCTIFPPISADNLSFQNGKLTGELWLSPTAEIPDITVGLIAYHSAGNVDRVMIESENVDWVTTDEGHKGKLMFPIGDASPMGSLMINFQGEHAARFWLRDPKKSFSNLVALHKTFDPKNYTESLFENGAKESFEDRVNLLVTLLGGSPLHYGKIGQFTDAPDIVVFSKFDEQIYLIECTTGDVNNKGKVDKLSARASKVKEDLAAEGQVAQGVVPIIAADCPREQTRGYWPLLHQKQIALACREQLVELLDRLDFAPDARTLAQIIQSWIPNVPSTVSSVD
ncbi:MAG: hypothetical protein E6Q98_23005 [Rhodospirillaceae bacterium]|nr:MAG: hypothetical protein E6Q98_23005 [Rhodospirillaceae bacterium]